MRRIAIALALSALVLAAGIVLLSRSPRPDLPEQPRFALRDVHGEPVSDRSMAGRPYALFFGYTGCPDVCPTTLSRLVAARRAAGAGPRLAILFVTVDPRNDTPDIIARYLAAFDTNLIGLHGTQAEIRHAENAFAVTVRRGDDGGTIVHTATIFLIDPNGRLRDAVSPQESPEKIARRIEKLLGT